MRRGSARMRLLVIAIGRLKQGPERDLAERYRERFDDIGRKLGFRGLEIHEIPESRARDAATRMAEEAAAISAAIPEKSVLVALDERGKNIDSAAFAPASWPLARRGGRQHYFRDRRRGRTFARIAAQGETERCVRRRDLAASDGSRDASGTDLPGRDHSGRPSLSPRLSRASVNLEMRTDRRSMQPTRNIQSYPTPPVAVSCVRSAFRFPSHCCPPACRHPSRAGGRPGRGAAAAADGSVTRRHQAARAGTRSHPRDSRRAPRNCKRSSRPKSRRSDRTAASSMRS